MAEKLASYLEEVNLSVVACEEGKALGEGTDIRVFDVQHIKGLNLKLCFSWESTNWLKIIQTFLTVTFMSVPHVQQPI